MVNATVSIYDSNGTVIEEGEAIQHENGLDWLYTITVQNENITGNKIVIKVTDMPGNITSQEQVI